MSLIRKISTDEGTPWPRGSVVKLNELFEKDAQFFNCDPDVVTVEGVQYDSRSVAPGDVFFAIGGFSDHGERYIDDAIRRGAVAIVTAWDTSVTVPEHTAWVKVVGVRHQLSYASSIIFRSPSDRMRVIGVTGTNGKTSICHILESILIAAGHPTGLIGTLGFRYQSGLKGSNAYQTVTRTTPESTDLQGILHTFQRNGVCDVVMEVSSHGLSLNRVDHVNFECGVFSNLTQDHIDFHGSMENYFKAKQRLFTELLAVKSVTRSPFAVVCVADVWGRRLVDALKPRDIPCFGYCLNKRESQDCVAYMRDIQMSFSGSRAELVVAGDRINITTPLFGKHNMQNIVAAALTAHKLGISQKAIQDGVNAFSGVPGRMERVLNDRGIDVWVDFAHTPNALEAVLSAVSPLKTGRLIVVMGAGGDRDPGKRPLMGAVCEKWADTTIVTTDNPRHEDPTAIIDAIAAGFSSQSQFQKIPERFLAIGRAIRMARKGDCVLIAGKGHEMHQIIGDRKIAWDDRAVAQKLMEAE